MSATIPKSSSPSIYDNSNFAEDTPPQLAFPSNYDFDQDPVAAMTSYSKVMHQHTQRQMEAATGAARRRSGTSGSDNSMATLSSESTRDSISSTAS